MSGGGCGGGRAARGPLCGLLLCRWKDAPPPLDAALQPWQHAHRGAGMRPRRRGTMCACLDSTCPRSPQSRGPVPRGPCVPARGRPREPSLPPRECASGTGARTTGSRRVRAGCWLRRLQHFPCRPCRRMRFRPSPRCRTRSQQCATTGGPAPPPAGPGWAAAPAQTPPASALPTPARRAQRDWGRSRRPLGACGPGGLLPQRLARRRRPRRRPLLQVLACQALPRLPGPCAARSPTPKQPGRR